MKKLLLVFLCVILVASLPAAATIHAPLAPVAGHHWLKVTVPAQGSCGVAATQPGRKLLDSAFTLRSLPLDGQWWKTSTQFFSGCTCTDSTCICQRCCFSGHCGVICG